MVIFADMSNLTDKQENFCNKYIECNNAAEAYRYAYSCEKSSDKTIWENACRLLGDIKVAARIEAMRAELREAARITKLGIVERLENIIDANIVDYVKVETEDVTIDGQPYKRQVVTLTDFDQLTRDQLAAVQSVQMGKNGIVLKLEPKMQAMDMLNKMEGNYAAQKHEIKSIDDMTDAELEQRINEYRDA